MKNLCLLVFSVVMIFNLSANEHEFSIGASLGLLNGQAQEIVYRDSRSDNKLSELLWNFNSLFYAGLDIKYSWLKPENKWGIFANGSFKYGFPGGTDVIEDRDWMIDNYPNWLTHYSVHDNKTESAYLIDFNLGAQFLISNKFLLKTYVSYHSINFSWTANGGSLLYPYELDKFNNPIDGHILLESINVGTYEQTWHIISPALSFYGEFNPYFDIEISLEVTPFTWCTAVDEHLMRDLVYTDEVKGGLFIEPSLLFSFKPSAHFVLSFFFAYREISKTRGDTKCEKAGVLALTVKNQAGAGFTSVDFGIIAKYKIASVRSEPGHGILRRNF
jgi:outer membrane protease